MKNRATLLLALLFAVPAEAQDPCEGNHLGPVYMQTSPGYLGGSFDIDLGSPAAPLGVGLLSISGGYGPVFHPLLGTVCLDVYSPFYQVLLVPFDAAGNFHLSVGLPGDPALLGAPPLYAAPTALVGGQIWNGKTLPLYFTFPDSWTPTADLPVARAFMEATNLGDGPQDNRIQVFVSGGATGTIVEPVATAETWIYQPLDRTILAGPTMAVGRVFHTQTKLDDGRLLIVGGNDTTGICHRSGAIYDHVAGTLTPIADMGQPRAGHAATLLPDGRVLVTGGLADYQNAGTALKAALDTAQSSAEIYDPATDTWTPAGNTMSFKRAGHGQTPWPDGRVLVIAGVNGGTFALQTGNETAAFTSSCDWFDPATDTFSPAPFLPSGRGFFGGSFLGDGRYLTSGGMGGDPLGGSAVATTTLYAFDGTTWAVVGLFSSLPIGVAFHTQETMDDGRAVIVGGFTSYLDYLEASYYTVFCDGASVVTGANVGQSTGSSAPVSGRGGHTLTRMWDGTLLVLGGISGSPLTTIPEWPVDTGFVYAP